MKGILKVMSRAGGWNDVKEQITEWEVTDIRRRDLNMKRLNQMKEDEAKTIDTTLPDMLPRYKTFLSMVPLHFPLAGSSIIPLVLVHNLPLPIFLFIFLPS